MSLHERTLVRELADFLGIDPISPDWRGLDAVLPILERMRSEGCIVLVKWDGERTKRPYTVHVSGKPLDGDYLRTDSASLEDGLAFVIVRYAAQKWSFPFRAGH